MAARKPEFWSITLEQGAAAPGDARHAIADWLVPLPVRVRENALITVTELVTNAVRFGRPPIDVRARLAADVLTVEVSDRGDDRPHRRVPTEEGGIGLNLVYFLADRVEIDRDRSRVRCEFDAAATSPRPSIAGTHGEPYGVDLAREGTALRIALRGDVDLTARAELEWLFAEVERARPEHVVIDLGEVTFVDSTGLRMAYRFDRWGRDNGAAVVFTRASPEVMRAFETAGLALRLMFSDTP